MRQLLPALLVAACSPPEPELNREPACRHTGHGAALTWTIPVKDRVLLDAWCATVGPPVIRLAGDSTTTTRPDSVVVIAWNVHIGGGNLEALVRDLRQGRFTNGEPVQHFVVLLQEALRIADTLPTVSPGEVPDRVVDVNEGDGTRSDVVRTAATLGLALVYVPSMRNGATHAEDRGNAILSSLPLSRPFAVELPFERQRRVSVGASIQLADTTILVTSVHFENRSRELLNSFGGGRLRQATAMVRALPTDAPVILGGDLNTWFLRDAELTLRLLQRNFPSTPSIEIGATYSLFGLGRTTDHLFFRLPRDWHATFRRINDMYGSDHYPVIGVAAYARARQADSTSLSLSALRPAAGRCCRSAGSDANQPGYHSSTD